MKKLDEESIKNILKKVKDINSNANIIETGTLSNLIITEDLVSIILVIKHEKTLYDNIVKQCEKYLNDFNSLVKYNIVLTTENLDSNVKSDPNIKSSIKPEKVKYIIAVASGKGGVGKSTLTTNLAISLSNKNFKIGILDADIYGPSQPRMLGIKDEKPTQNKYGKITTVDKYGVKCMSIGLLIDEDKPMIWRGPMVQGALEQLIKDVDWGELDILFVDMPPGTGDVQLTMSQRVSLTGAIIVSTPQDIALIDARKGLNMFKKVNVPIVGIVENMSYYQCPKCNDKTMLFGDGGAKKTAIDMNVPFLGEVPLDIEIRINSDNGEPNKIFSKGSNNSIHFDEISNKVLEFIKNDIDQEINEPTIKFE
ncbi:MAG: P-loop NTPase [Alphaproteobacteria bacterium]